LLIFVGAGLAEISYLTYKVIHFEADLDKKLDKIDAKFDKIDAKFDKIDTQFSGLRHDLIHIMALASIGRLPVEIAEAQEHNQDEHDGTVYGQHKKLSN
jgi:hypothetical protein